MCYPVDKEDGTEKNISALRKVVSSNYKTEEVRGI